MLASVVGSAVALVAVAGYAAADVFDVAPLLFSIKGKPQSGGVRESHLTLFPLFHYGTSPEQSLFVIPGYLRRVTKTADTMITPLLKYG